MRSIEELTENLPDAQAARLFFAQLTEKSPNDAKKLVKNESLLSDVLTITAFSPLLATTILQNPDYIFWLNRQRESAKVRGKEEILESLARFALVNSNVETNILLARFRRRELLRIYLRDIRRHNTLVEITEEISSLADAILEYALRIARQELDNRFGNPLEFDQKNREKPAQFSVVALGKLGSKELNYSSDIDLLFLFSNNGKTSGRGLRGTITNREYFVKLAEFISKLVGGQAGEGAAYRVDLRLRPNGRVGALAISVEEAVNYYQKSAQNWERQVLIRSRSSAGDERIFQNFYEQIKTNVFSATETVENALRSVRLSKEKINVEKVSDQNFNVKLGRGGIREIEFIAQALQLAYGGKDEWLRAAHTLISLSRLADRRLISDSELTELFEAYEFLRRLEHRLQMENGLQTHIVSNEPEKRLLTAKRMNFATIAEFDSSLKFHAANVNRIFRRVFGEENISFNAENNAVKTSTATREFSLTETIENSSAAEKAADNNFETPENQTLKLILSSLEKSDTQIKLNKKTSSTLERLSKISPHFAQMLAANPRLIVDLPNENKEFAEKDFQLIFLEAVEKESIFARQLAVLRKIWSQFLLEIVVSDIFGKIDIRQAKSLQTALAEASIEIAILITRRELERRFSIEKIAEFPFAVLGLGKLGGGGMDYNSDLDLILIYDDEKPLPIEHSTHAEFYSRAAEIFVTALSSLTREGFLYRVDLRLRPDGKNGATVSGKNAFLNYLDARAAMWEWLAYVKLRAVAGDLNLAKSVESDARQIIHEKARESVIQNSNSDDLRNETRRIRERLEEEKSTSRKGKEIDIKFGAGGMLDVYFAMRFLQLRDDVRDDSANRSTVFMLEKLHESKSLDRRNFQNFKNGYEFLSALDHNLRLTVGRSTRLPLGNRVVLQIIAERMHFDSIEKLLEKLTAHRLEIRASFENILKD